MSRGGSRIAGGELRGRRVAVPDGVRPTGGRLKEALFSMWADRVPGSRFLDLFAGSGAVGLEALSRGADSVIWVEGDGRIAHIARRNVVELGSPAAAVVVARLPALTRPLPEGPYSLVFADPPYAFERYEELLATVDPLLARGGAVAVEHAARVSLPERAGRLRATDDRSYGDSRLTLFASVESDRTDRATGS